MDNEKSSPATMHSASSAPRVLRVLGAPRSGPRRWRGGAQSRKMREAGVADAPALRLAGEAADRLTPRPDLIEPMQGGADPRWVLAIRTAEALQGPILLPERRERLLRVGKLLGLAPFDINLVIAIVQDRARRGILPEQCPSAGIDQLEMVPLPRKGGREGVMSDIRNWRIAAIVGCLITVELLMLVKLFN